MAVLTQEGNLALEIKIRDTYDWEADRVFDINYEFSLTWRGKPVVNSEVLKHNDYWGIDGTSTFVATDWDRFFLLATMQKAIETMQMQCWEPWPVSNMQVAIWPNRTFDLIPESGDPCGEGQRTIIVAPDIYQYDDQDRYCGPAGATFILTVKIDVFRQFVKEFADECAQIQLPQRLKEKR